MGRPMVVLDVASDHALARDLAAGGVFAPGCALPLLEECDLVVRAGNDELVLAARVVFVDTGGAGLELVACTPEMKQQIAAMAGSQSNDDGNNDDATDDDVVRKIPLNIHERLRGLSLQQQIKAAQT